MGDRGFLWAACGPLVACLGGGVLLPDGSLPQPESVRGLCGGQVQLCPSVSLFFMGCWTGLACVSLTCGGQQAAGPKGAPGAVDLTCASRFRLPRASLWRGHVCLPRAPPPAEPQAKSFLALPLTRCPARSSGLALPSLRLGSVFSRSAETFYSITASLSCVWYQSGTNLRRKAED